ncbi:MAG: hypothetical protein CME06_10780 [Gemmatimonadetes bacterium]|nr:hypothetical protein [Gemmatimonadota bacterium]
MTNAPPLTLFRGGPIHTMLGPRLDAGAVLCCGGSIDYVGPVEGLDRARTRGAEIVELDGRPLLPGFCDSHVHMILAAQQFAAIDLRDIGTLDQLINIVANRAASRGAGEWITGYGWERESLLTEGPLSSALLDAATMDHPVFLVSKDCHSAWLNTSALRRLEALPRLPVKSQVERNDGRPSGLVFEDVFYLREMLLPPLADTEKERALASFVRHLWGCGITAVHTQETSSDLELLLRHQARSQERVRVLCNLVLPEAGELEVIADSFHATIPNWLGIGGAKIFLDGSFGSLTAAVTTPYARGGGRGILSLSDTELGRWLDACATKNLPAVMHAIGDRAVEQALRCLKGRKWPPGTRHRLEHAQLLSQRILARHDLRGLIFSGQPSHMWPDRGIVERNLPNPTAKRWTYPYRTIQKCGAILVFGSDAPIETPHPWKGIEAAVTRLESAENSPWIAEESITLTDALSAHTSRPALIHGHAFRTGTLERGRSADLVILDRDPWEVFDRDPSELRHIQVEQTFVEGERVYRQSNRRPPGGTAH